MIFVIVIYYEGLKYSPYGVLDIEYQGKVLLYSLRDLKLPCIQRVESFSVKMTMHSYFVPWEISLSPGWLQPGPKI